MSAIPPILSHAHLSFISKLSVIPDPRMERHRCYPLLNILVFTFVAIFCGLTSWYEIADFVEDEMDWLSMYLDVSSGIPSHDTFRRVIGLLQPGLLEKVIIEWIEEMRQLRGFKENRVIALDEKSFRGVP
jgi:hypothetical protein